MELRLETPGADSSSISISLWAPAVPGNAEEMLQLRQGFGSFMDLVVGEDFQLLAVCSATSLPTRQRRCCLGATSRA
jgi:hypothetical protein